MRIAVVGTRGFPGVQGGVETYCERLYPLLVERGCQVTVFARMPYLRHKTTYEYNGVRVVPLSCPKNKYLEAFVHTLKALMYICRMKPDIVHVHAVGPSFFAPFFRLCGMKVVMTHQGPDYLRKKWGWFARLFLRASEYMGVRWSNHVVIVSDYIAGLISYTGQKHVSVIPNGVAEAVHVPSDGMMGTYGLEPGKYILAVGRLVPEKGFTDLISAYERLRFEIYQDGIPCPWKLVIVGEADHADTYSRAFKTKAHQVDDVVLTGFLSGRDLGEMYTHAGMFVIPSYHEGLPLALLEALSYGLSCLASHIPAHQGVGLPPDRFFRAGDVGNLCVRLRQHMFQALPEEQKAGQIASIRARYNWEHIADQILRVYCEVASLSVPCR